MAAALDFTPPFEPGIFDFLAARAVTGVEETSLGETGGRRYARALALAGGHGWFRISWDGAALLLEHAVESATDTTELLRKVRHLFNLAHCPAAADAVLTKSQLLAPRVAALPGIRLPGCTYADEILIRAMVGQQVTVAAARTALNQLAALGTSSRLPLGSVHRFFPTPAQIAAGGRSILRGPERRLDSIVAVAEMLASGALAISAKDTEDSLAAKLLPIPGIGPWTVGYVAMRILGSSDVFLPNDSAVRNGCGLLRGDTPAQARSIKAAELNAIAEPLRPWRSYATLHLWRRAGEK